MKAAIIIPSYRTTLDPHERVALEQCLKILTPKHPIVQVRPDDRESGEYRDYGSIHSLPGRHFSSINDYSRLLLSAEFYDHFRDYDYMLIHQTDAFVFRDELDFWCGRGLDYAGAPWIGQPWLEGQRPKWAWRSSIVGNGGFSLRRVSTFRRMARLFRPMIDRFIRKTVHSAVHEDVFWSLHAPSLNPLYKIADLDTALRFAFETEPAECFERSQHRLPFGCHAWEKHLDFWAPHMRALGYEV